MSDYRETFERATMSLARAEEIALELLQYPPYSEIQARIREQEWQEEMVRTIRSVDDPCVCGGI